MSASVSLLPDGDGLSLSGTVDFASAEACLNDGLALIGGLAAGTRPWVCDLSGLASGSSVTAAVLMSWQRAAGRRQQTLTLRALPARLHAILQASNLLPVFSPALDEPR